MPQPPLSREEAQRTVDAVNECLEEGFRPVYSKGGPGSGKTAMSEAAVRLNIAWPTMRSRLEGAERMYGLKPDDTLYRAKAPFSIDPLPWDGEPDAETLIEHLKAQSANRMEHDRAKQLYQVRVTLDGPIGIALFGDPHVDSPGTDWVALERDVKLARDTPGVLAVNLGDTSDNWVGRLMGLYAHADVPVSRTGKLIEWLLRSLPWLVTVGGNHDLWHTETADPMEIIHRLREMPGLYQGSGARLQLNLPSGCSARMHVRHDFPGRSQFNPGHAFVRETLFGYRDHILACGHRHQTGYIPVWHNDPRMLCHGLRSGSYKVIDSFAHEKHFKPENWAPALMVVIDPDYADDPVRFIRPSFSLEEGCEYLTWRRQKWETGKRAAA